MDVRPAAPPTHRNPLSPRKTRPPPAFPPPLVTPQQLPPTMQASAMRSNAFLAGSKPVVQAPRAARRVAARC